MRRRWLLTLIPFLAAPAARADRFPPTGATPFLPPGRPPLSGEPALPPWPPTRWNPVGLAESQAGRRFPQDLRHAMLRDAGRLRDESIRVHQRWILEVAAAAGLDPTEAGRRLGLPRSPYRPSADVARVLGAPLPAIQTAQARRIERLEALRLSLAQAWSRALDIPPGAALALIPPVEGAP